MFNKPSMFPKTTEPQSTRTTRPLGTSSGVADDKPSSGTAAVGVSSQRDSSVTSAPAADEVRSETAAPAAEMADAGGSRLIVGPDVKLKGAEILDCDTLVVEGRVEATMDSRVIRIAENGAYQGTVGIDVAEIHGNFDGELTARKQLIIHATGRVSGKIRYGTIFIEEGGEISGDVQSLAKAGKDSKEGREGLRQVETNSESKPRTALAS